MAAFGAVVLAGGRSSRMGRPKADLEWHGSTLLRRTVEVVARAVDGPVVVVRAVGQSLPRVPPEVKVVEDSRAAAGPLQGIADGLAAVEAPAAFVCSTDLPFLHPAFVRRVVDRLGDADVALPVVGGFRQPLAAAYRTALAATAADLLARGESRPARLLDAAAVVLLDEQALLADPCLRRLDPDLRSVVGVNDLAAYEQARARPAPDVVVQHPGGRQTVQAATLQQAAAAVGTTLGQVRATVDGRPADDPETALVTGDVVTLAAAG